MNKKERWEWALKELNRYKAYFDYGDWTIYIEPKIKEASDAFVQVDSDYYEKELVVQLYTGFFKCSEQKQREHLIHELVHSRVKVFQEKCEALISEEEEFMVNAFARALRKMEDEKNEKRTVGDSTVNAPTSRVGKRLQQGVPEGAKQAEPVAPSVLPEGEPR